MTEGRNIQILESPSQRVTETLARAFQDDPAISWMLPDPERRRRTLPGMFEVLAEQSHRCGHVIASPSQAAVALLYPPGKIKDDGLWDTLRLIGVLKTALARGLKLAEAMHAHHPDPQPYTYLRYLAVAPEHQGEGWGGAVVRDVIGRAAILGQGVLLETAKDSNVAIYSRLGFAITDEWSVPGGGPKFWTMVHPAP